MTHDERARARGFLKIGLAQCTFQDGTCDSGTWDAIVITRMQLCLDNMNKTLFTKVDQLKLGEISLNR